MAASSSDSLQQYLGEFRNSSDIIITSFERELGHIFNEHKQTSRNLYTLLNKYESKLDSTFYKKSLIRIGDHYRSLQVFDHSDTHGYGRYLQFMGVALSSLVDLFDQSNQREDTELNLRAVIGTCYCTYKIIIDKDTRLMVPANRSLCLSLLHHLTQCFQYALKTESHYWLLYNAITLSYSISRLLMSINLSKHVIESLIWCCLSMESCVPLMTIRYLQLRGSLYTAVCQCYYTVKYPLEAELFGRRCLEKVHQLAQIHSQSANTNSLYSDIFTEVTIKLCVMVFKRSVLETHKRTRSILRPKVRPTIKDLLQSQWPRSPTERLLDEMFNGKAAQFLAITECLLDSMTRPLQKVPPHPVTDLDNDTITDVYQEIVTAGVDLANETLLLITNNNNDNQSLLELAIKGSNIIPLQSIIYFIHKCYNNDYIEPIHLLATKTIQYCNNDGYLNIIITCEEIKEILKRTTVLEDKEVWIKSQIVLNILYSSIDKCLLSTDLVMDAIILIWNGCGPLYNTVLSHDIVNKSLLTTNRKYITFLNKILTVYNSMGMATIDTILYCKVLMKYILLLEIDSCIQHTLKHIDQESSYYNPFIKYDRAKLLYCQQELYNGLLIISKARQIINNNIINNTDAMIQFIHTELVCTEIRIAVKLASTIPPQCPFQDSIKPSSLPSKVEKREQEKELWTKMLSSLTAPDAIIPSEEELLKGCGSDKYRSAILLMTIAMYNCNDVNNIEKGKIHKLLKESYSQLVSSTKAIPPSITNKVGGVQSVPSPPILVYRSPNTMIFSPAPFITTQPILYYSLYGRIASGSNIKVRINDQQYIGLGIQIPVNDQCILRVTGLKPHVEYIFAIAAYGPGGQLIGQSIGLSTNPILSSHCLSNDIAFDLLCQIAYNTNNYTIAIKSAELLWKQFSLTTNDKGVIPTYRIRPDVLLTTPTPLLQLFVISILTGVHSQLINKELYPCSTNGDTSLLTSQRDRLQLISKLLIAIKLCGWLNDHTLCLQIVVICYTLLIPLLQLQIITDEITKVLIDCITVIQLLPDNVLVSINRNDVIINGLHHMIAVLGYTLIKIFSDSGEKAAIPHIIDLCRTKLILTLPTLNTYNNDTPTIANDTPTGGYGKLQIPSLTSTLSTGGLTGSTSHSSILFPGQSSNGGGGRIRTEHKKRRKKTMSYGDIVPDETKTIQYKTIESFFNNTAIASLNDLELTGQEELSLLHIAINTMTIQQAYREVIKFKRRPQYLQYFVHLAGKAFSYNKGEIILEWSRDVFAWLKRRNEIVLSTKNPQIIKPDQTNNTNNTNGGSYRHTLGNSFNHTLQSSSITKGDSITGSVGVAKGNRRTPSKISLKTSTQLMLKETKGALNKKGGKSPSMGISKITRDDLKVKAIATLQNLLPKLWRISRCRKKYKVVCIEEQPWRSKINMLLASCLLQNIIDKITPTTNHSKLLPPDWFRFDVCSHIIEWVVPPYPPCMPDKVDTPQSPTTPINNELLMELKQLMVYLQRAIVNAYRGGCWVLVINSCRVLWNTLTVIKYNLYYNNDEDIIDDLSMAMVYGISLQCIYIGADILIHVYKDINKCINQQQVSTSVAMAMSDNSFLYQFLSLSFIICYTNHHWEKLLTLEQAMSNTQRCLLHDLIKPIITVSRQCLTNRINTHASLITRESIDPAAHLDIKSYNIYGQTGYSLGMSTIPLEDTTVHEISPSPNRGKEILTDCHRLYSQYLATRNTLIINDGCGSVNDGCGSVITITTIEHVIDRYKEAIDELKKNGADGCGLLQLQAMHELGNILYYLDDKRSSSKWWLRGLKLLLHCKEPLIQWRELDLFKQNCILDILGIKGCVLGGILASKMGSYIHCGELDIRLEYHHIATALFKSIFRSSMPHPLNDIDYISYSLKESFSLGVELFTDHYQCSISLFLSSIHDTIKEMLLRGYAIKTFSLLTLYEHISSIIARNINHTVLSRVYRVNALIQINMYSNAIQSIKRLMIGADLPNLSNEYYTIPDTSIGISFDDQLPLNSNNNMKALATLMDKNISPTLSDIYGVIPTTELLLTKARLLISIAATCTNIPEDVSSHHHDNNNRSSSSVSLLSRSSSQIGGQQQQQPLTIRRMSKGNLLDVSYDNIKTLLLDNAQTILTELCHQDKVSITHTVMVYIVLSELHMCLFHYSNAVNMALNAIRILQQSTVPIDPLLWLQTRAALANSISLLATPLSPSLSMTTICQEGVQESQAMGAIEIAALFLYLSGVYHYISIQPPDINRVQRDVTESLQVLGTSIELSVNGVLLKCKASLLLAETTETDNNNNMVKIYQGISNILQEQIILLSSTTNNICHPHHSLKLMSDLRLACIMSKTDSAHSERILKEGLLSLTNNLLMKGEYLTQLAMITNCSSNILDAILSSTALGIDYTITKQLYITLCEKLVAVSNETTPPLINTTDSPVTSKRSQQRRRSIPEQHMKGFKTPSADNNKQVPRSDYQSWCSLRLANTCIKRMNTIIQLSSELHNNDINITVPKTVLKLIPNCIINDLVSAKGITDILMNDTNPLPLDKLLPKMTIKDVTWFTLIGHYQKLVRRCFKSSDSMIGLRTHCLSNHFILPIKALLDYLLVYCVPFINRCAIPTVPTPLLLLSSETTPTYATPTDTPSYLTSEEGEVSILWYESNTLGVLKGFVSLNHKAIRSIPSISSSSPYMKSTGAEVIIVTASSLQLEELCLLWEGLSQKCSQFISDQAIRPLSRSPSRMKRKTLEVVKKGVPSDLLDIVQVGVVQLAQVFSLTTITEVSVHAVPCVLRVLRATELTPEKGDTYLFFKQVFTKDK